MNDMHFVVNMVCIGIFGFMGMHVKKQTVQRRWSVEKRLEFIDFRLYWEGQINRSDIRDRFGVALLQASKDIAQYQEAAPKNLDYDLREKRYFSARTFKPAFLDPDSEAYLWQMRDDVSAMSGIDGAWLPDLPPHDIVRMPRRNVAAETLREIVLAIRRKKAAEILYQSMSSEEPAWRAISPHAFAFDGLRWHVRAFCHRRQKHKDFLLSRVQDMRESGESPVSRVQDAVWNEIFTVTLKPHPKLSKSQAQTVAWDYNMQDMRLGAPVRLALLYYFLRRMGLEDCDGDKRDAREQHVVIANKAETRKAKARAQYEEDNKNE